MYKIKKEFSICCSHRLHNNEWSEDENRRIYGRCNNLPSHGHNYKIILFLKSITIDSTGMIMNFNKLKEHFNKIIDNRFDHKFLNDDITFKNLVPTAENMAQIFYTLLKEQIEELYKVEIYETEGASAIYEVN